MLPHRAWPGGCQPRPAHPVARSDGCWPRPAHLPVSVGISTA